MRALKFITGHVIYNLDYTYKFQLKTTYIPETSPKFLQYLVFTYNFDCGMEKLAF